MSHNDLLRIQKLKVCAGEKEILHGIDLDIHENEVHVLMGPNGTGKSTLGAALMGNPAYTVTGGDIIYKGQNINEMPDNERAKNGIFLSFQNPIEIPGITVSAFIRSALEAKTGKRVRLFSFKKELEAKMELLQMDPSYAERDLNVGFSGGEKKKTEILQMLMLNPEFVILDETDSGLDIDALRTVANGVNKLKKPENATIVITHYQRLLDYIVPDVVHVLYDGRIVKTAGKELVAELEEKGYDWIKEEVKGK